MTSSFATQVVSFRDGNYDLDVPEEFVFTDTKPHPYYIESPKKNGIYGVRSITDNDYLVQNTYIGLSHQDIYWPRSFPGMDCFQ